jgi:hypothetical protein
MPAWIHDKAKHLRRKNPGMSEGQSFAIATQQAHASGNSPKGYGTKQGRRDAHTKYDKSKSQYTQTADPKTKTAQDLSTSPAEAGSTTRRPQMHAKLAGRLPLHEMIAQHLDSARTKLAAAEEKDDKKDEKKDKVKKLLKYEEKEHGHIPSVKEEESEKKASVAGVVDFHDPDQMDKLASALELLGDQLEKDADSIENGAEKKQGGEQLATQSPTPGKQPYKHDKSKSHNVPTSTASTGTKDNPGAKTAVETDEHKTPGGKGAKMPPNILRKTAGQSVKDRIAAAAKKAAGETEEPVESESAEVEEEKTTSEAEKKASAADYILGKLAEAEGGGEKTPDDEKKTPGYGSAKIPAEGAKVSNKDQIKNVTKRDAKSPRKAELAQVLTEPAMSAAHDSKVQENLRNASKGGVKIAGAKAFLQKIAEGGCKCGEKGECRYCKLKSAVGASKKAS